MTVVNWAVHAKHLSWRTGFAAACLVVCVDLFTNSGTDWPTIVAALLFGVIISTVTYWILYWLTYFFSEEKSLPYTNVPFSTEVPRMDESPEFVFGSLNAAPPLGLKIGARMVLYRDGVTERHMILLASAVQNGLDKVSQRSLHTNKIADRFSEERPTPADIIEWLGVNDLIVPAGNSQHNLTPELKLALEQLIKEQEK